MAYCDRCDRWFNSEYAYNAHRRDSSSHYMCWKCDKDFQTSTRLDQHLRQSSRHNYCTYCDEDFEDQDDLNEHYEDCHEFCHSCNMHRNSSIHRPRNITCPGNGRNAQFVNKSALLLHFEGGSCKSGLTRQKLNRLIAERDSSNFITNPNRLLTGSTETWATQKAWNGHAYECYFCHKEFRSLAQLNQHLASPVHEQPLYHCPKLGHGCRAQFKTASGLCQHIEDGSCGVARFKAIQDSMEILVRGVRRIAF
ncbi:zinc-finger double-stranded RNA-binding domain-containing protein [Rhizoctonia solani AG-1 IA]|uniref:Zinc-finger double-stranded RNA-binding domain-containing protein n=1 Tax=Thanatephorus cucumeris (strain AG1-IA) TaxID=983506 RepID=L8X6C1_THACA|nr:zinc-finger double-stranded RNA-binding domain-containing protein [Rhizoctonia solani AG-1 IA]